MTQKNKSMKTFNPCINFARGEKRVFLKNYIAFVPPSRMRYQSFAIGFFGFHHIRAINENDFALQQESRRILSKLAAETHLDTRLLHELKCVEKQSYCEFWDNVLSKIAYALGDTRGQRLQNTIKLSFWLAAAYACMVGMLNEKKSEHMKSGLSILENWTADLLEVALQAEISEASIYHLKNSRQLLQTSKTRSVAHKLIYNIELLISENLLLKTVNQTYSNIN